MEREIFQVISLITTEYDLPPFSDERIEMWVQALGNFPPGSVMASARKYIVGNRFKPQLADIVAGCNAAIDGQWIGADEAWGLMPKSEHESAMMTDEMAQAMAAANPSIEAGDRIAARMTFKDVYTRLVERAKLEGRQPRYFPSFGSDSMGRVSMLAKAVTAKQISLDRATEALPELADQVVRMVGVKSHPLLSAPSNEGRERIKALMLSLKVMA